MNRLPNKRGVVQRSVHTKGGIVTSDIPLPMHNEYLAFALANKHKSWARRWLREHYMRMRIIL